MNEKILAGVKLLDEKRPGWYNEIDLSTFNFARIDLCVLGQIFGDYDEGLQALEIPVGVRYGFDYDYASAITFHGEPYALMETQWIEVIVNKRKEANAA